MVLYKVLENNKFEEFKQEDFGSENYEKDLEIYIEKNPTILLDGEKIFFIKKEKKGEKTQDLLGIDKNGNTIIIELKSGKTPRDVIAQAIEYAAEVRKLNNEDLDKIAIHYFTETSSIYKSLQHAYNSIFLAYEEGELPTFNQKQRIIIVGQDIDKDIEKVARYLRENYNMDIHCLKFSYYKTNSGEIIFEIDRIVGREETYKPKIIQNRADGKYKEFFDIVVYKLKEKLDEEFKNFETNPANGKYLLIRYYKNNLDIRFEIKIFEKDSFGIYMRGDNENLMSYLKKKELEIKQILKNSKFRTWDIKDEYIDWQEPSTENTELIENITNRLKLYIETLKPILDEFLEKNKI